MTQALLSAPELPKPTQQFQRFVPLSVYFSKQYLALHPDFMPDFAHSISQCQVQAPSLSREQKLQVQGWAASYLNDWRKQSALLHTLRAAAKAARPSLAVLQQADETWLNEQQQKLQPLISQVLESPLSVKLKRMVSDDARLSEGLLADVYGRLLAASGITTDFYQGDEYWFQACEALPDSELLVGSIEYDESTKQLAARVSGAIHDPDSKAFLGVVALNINVDQL